MGVRDLLVGLISATLALLAGFFALLYFTHEIPCRRCSIAQIELSDLSELRGSAQKHALARLGDDPWNRPYYIEPYAARGSECVVVFSMGADGSPGGTGPDSDIVALLPCQVE